MHYQVTATVVHDGVLWGPTGEFGRWARSIKGELGSAGFFEAPINQRTNKTAGQPPVGSLKAGIEAELQQVTLRRYDITLSSSVFYSLYVLKGTGRIYSRGEGGRFGAALPGEGMYLPSNLGYKARWRQSVRGQDANPFLQRAWNTVAAHHSSMGRLPTR